MNQVRAWSSRLFHRFGIHCATHQIRLILISGLVITSLFYPALGIYSNAVAKLLSIHSSPVARLLPLTPLPFHEDEDLVNIWYGQDALRIIKDPVARARCGKERTIRVERVLLTNNAFDYETGAINHQTLHSALKLESLLEDYLSRNNLGCLRSGQGCLVLSPLEYWRHDEDRLLGDPDLLQTVNRLGNITISGLPLQPSMVFAGRESIDPDESSLDFAAYVALTYFFLEDDCNGSSGHNAWQKALSEVASSSGQVLLKTQQPSFLTLEFNLEKEDIKHVSAMTITLYLCYFIFFVYFSGSMRRMDTVHSRVGLCFTGLVEIIVSTITSLSVCAIIGLRITLVPWGIFPIVIVFVGAENMFRLIDEVVKTPVSLPVKERIGIGLGRAGTSNTLKVVSYNTILGVIAFFARGAIHQFCVFAIVVLVAHWFLIHTFFVAVLSIDIQRLELDDLLRINSNLVSPKDDNRTKRPVTSKQSFAARVGKRIQGLTEGRLTRNFSLLLLLVITAALYYSTLPPSPIHAKPLVRSPATRASVLRSKAEESRLSLHSEARTIWRTFGADESPIVHLRVETPAVITLDRQFDEPQVDHRIHRQRWSIRLLWWVFRVMVVPIGATLSSLYVLLLYLLKGAETLENRRYSDEEEDIVDKPIERLPTLRTYPRVFSSDVNLLASNRDGSVVASVSSDGEFHLWLALYQRYIQVDTTGLVLRSATSSSVQCALSTVTVDDLGTFCAVGTGSGIIGVWSIHNGSTKLIAQYSTAECASPVTHLEIGSSNDNTWNKGSANGYANSTFDIPQILALYANGRVIQWFNGLPMYSQPSYCGQVVKTSLVYPSGASYPVVCFYFDNGGLEIVDNYQALPEGGSIYIPAGTVNDLVEDVHICAANIEETIHILVAAVTTSGIITLWDGSTGECITTLDDACGSVNRLRLIPISPKACTQCGEVPLCSICLVYSVGHIVFVDRGFLARRCSCPLTQPLVSRLNSYILTRDLTLGKRSRSGSFVSSSGATDCTPARRSRHVSLSSDTAPDVSAFPISAHGIHSRRNGSEKGDGHSRRTSDLFERPVFSALEDIAGATTATGDLDEQKRLMVPESCRNNLGSSLSDNLNLWRNFKLVRVKEATCERGGWDVVDGGKIVGLRRKPRKRQEPCDMSIFKKASGNPEQRCTLSLSVLDRWEVWIVDPTKSDGGPQASSLSSLRLKPASISLLCSKDGQDAKPRLSFTRLSPLLIRNSICLSGFGNTIGIIDFNNSS